MPRELWLAKLDRLAAPQAEINSIVTDALQFISGLRFTLDQGLPQEKLCALRQCIERILIDKPGGSGRRQDQGRPGQHDPGIRRTGT